MEPDIITYPLPTTFETLTTARDGSLDPPNLVYPQPTGTKAPEVEMPKNPNFPWGASSPLHRHHNVTSLGSGMRQIGQGWLEWAGGLAGKLKSDWH